jgi:hypothetical protein
MPIGLNHHGDEQKYTDAKENKTEQGIESPPNGNSWNR